MSQTPAPRGPGRIVVGYEGGSTGHDAISFANRWARSTQDRVAVVTVHPGAASVGAGRVDAEWVAYERDEVDRLLREAQSLVDPTVDADYTRVDAGSAAHGLSDLVEHEVAPLAGGAAPLLVLGSRRNRGLRRTYPGSTADRVLHGVGAPTVLVPWGYADSEERTLRRVAVAYVDTPEGRAALALGVDLVRRLAGRLEVISVLPDTRISAGVGDARAFAMAQRRDYQDSLDAALAGVPDDVEAHGRLAEGPVVDALADLGLDDLDVLVAGSRGYGPVRRVLLGGISSRLVRHARLPVVLAPRGG